MWEEVYWITFAIGWAVYKYRIGYISRNMSCPCRHAAQTKTTPPSASSCFLLTSSLSPAMITLTIYLLYFRTICTCDDMWRLFYSGREVNLSLCFSVYGHECIGCCVLPSLVSVPAFNTCTKQVKSFFSKEGLHHFNLSWSWCLPPLGNITEKRLLTVHQVSEIGWLQMGHT